MQIEQMLQQIRDELKFLELKWIPLQKPLTLEFYQEWLKQGHAGEMSYLSTHLPFKEDPKKLLPQAKSVFVITEQYFPATRPHQKTKNLRVASYALNEDYHLWLKEKLSLLMTRLKAFFPLAEFYLFSDSNPVLERDLALQAGLGWIGKNTCLIDRKRGSLFFIGGLFSTLPASDQMSGYLQSKEMVQDFCGTCNRCVEICPTQAIKPSKVLEATKCISYLTIESQQVPAPELRSQIGDWFFGCDLCQNVCPWNQKIFAQKLETRPLHPDSESNHRQDLVEELRWLLQTSGKKLIQHFKGTPLERARPFGLKRNALIVIGNKKLTELKPEVEILLNDPKLGELAKWTIQSFK